MEWGEVIKMQSKLKESNGFTLIELVVVITIIGIIIGFATTNFSSYIKDMDVLAMQVDTETLSDASIVNYIKRDFFPATEEPIEDMSRLFEYLKDENNVANFKKIDENEIKKHVASSKNSINEYVIAVNGKYKGYIFHLSGLEDGDGNRHHWHEPEIVASIPPIDESKPNPVPKPEPGPDDKIDDLIRSGYIPIATANELTRLRDSEEQLFGSDTKWESKYTSGLDKKYIQVSDLDMSTLGNFTPIGNSLEMFTGVYNGGSYLIENLSVDNKSKGYSGLFGVARKASISNVSLENANIKGSDYTGSLVGLQDETIISNSYSTGMVYSSGAYTGGLVGSSNNSSLITKSYSTSSIESLSNYNGGLAGSQTNNSIIEDSYSTGNVYVKNAAAHNGGLVGFQNNSLITKSYTISTLSSEGAYTGGLVGQAVNSSIKSSYYGKDETGQVSSDGGAGKTTSEMKDINNYLEWDFNTIWNIKEGEYPTLK